MFDKTSDAFREKTLTRRTFLRGSGLLAAGVGIGLATSRSLFAQEDASGKKDGQKPADPAADAPAAEAPPETKLDSRGTPYRDCPECGGKMYKEDRTWLCEACGYSYIE